MALAVNAIVSSIILLLVFATISLTYPVQANYIPPNIIPMEHAYIRSDGQIDPPTLPIQRQDNVYTLTANIKNYSLEIQTDNIIFNGNNHTLSIPPYEYSTAGNIGDPTIKIVNRKNILITNTTFENCFYCVMVIGSTNATIAQNTMPHCNCAIYMDQSSNCTIIANNLQASSLVRNSTFIEISYNKISGTRYQGIHTSVSFSKITRNEFINNEAGLHMEGSDDNYIFNGHNHNNNIFLNNFVNNKVGILFRGDAGVNINNSIFNNYWQGNQAAIKNVDEGGIQYGETITDKSPLTEPVSILFDPKNLITPPPPTPTPTPPTINSTQTPTPTINPSPTIPEFTTWITMPLIVATVAFFAMLRKRATKNNSS